ncbi:MAG TPA: Uma2 family endonuclease [Pseudomonadota bacterium]|nr:Uma2 family endonuclease [Pseudomonadota bacterium]
MSTATARKLPPHHPGMEAERWNREVIRGVEMMSPRPAPRHVAIASQLGAKLGRHFNGLKGEDGEPGGWVLRDEPEIHLEGKDPVIPDIAGWRIERAPDEEPPNTAYYTAPDWVCEVLSPSTAKWDRFTKMPLYSFHRVGHMWLVDPAERQIEVYAHGRRGWELVVTVNGEDSVRLEPFEEIELPLSRIWPRARAESAAR